MKILGISLFMFILLAGISLGFDLLQGFNLSTILKTFNPLYVMELPELTVLCLLILILILRPVFSFLQKRQEKKR